MTTFTAVSVAFWLACIVAPVLCRKEFLRHAAIAVLLTTFSALLYVFKDCSPGQRLILTTVMMLYLFKSIILLCNPQTWCRNHGSPKSKPTPGSNDLCLSGLVLYMTAWPGMDPRPFRQRVDVEEDGRRFVQGVFFFVVGAVLAIANALCFGQSAALTAWVGLASLVLMIHFGYADILTTMVRISGWNVRPLFNSPLMSDSLHDFWSKRWNIAFVEMNKVLFIPLLQKGIAAGYMNKWSAGSNSLLPVGDAQGTHNAKRSVPSQIINGGKLPNWLIIALVFAISGILHELAISYPASGDWCGPFLYFAINGTAFIVEEKLLKAEKNEAKGGLKKRFWTWFWILVPLPLLVTPAFQQELILPLFGALNQFLKAHDLRFWFSIALWCAAIGNFCTTPAGLLMPIKLNWKEQLAKLTPFNRKIILNYYFYTGLVIIAWGVMTLVLHNELLDGDRSALCLSGFIGLFWLIRIIVDLFYFKHDEWPKGAVMLIGHTLLTVLFFALSFTYIGLVVWHCFTLG